jgi:thiosulfate/3-mercaptopyruvate sulfurtransferase
MTTALISPIELFSISQTEEFILIDASSSKDSKENYLKCHLEGALHVDLNSRLADIKSDVSIGGRHPLPSTAQFSKTLFDLGISTSSLVVIYDDKNCSNAAARFWWMLKSIGHEKVQVLDGGFQAAVKAGFPTSDKTEKPLNSEMYPMENWKLPLVDIQAVDKAILDDEFLIIDVRDEDRYNGKTEPIDLIAGHIPSAINVPFQSNLDSEGFYLSSSELKEKYLKVFNNRSSDKVIVHCGSGVTACHTLLAIASAGVEIPNLYVGSWSEWSRNGREIQ